ncbi:MAG: ABC transporter substrate-binding protein [Ferruginibacter sp.]|nr:ABC transporter substrate-binding protein [Cytophagales bacterium]
MIDQLGHPVHLSGLPRRLVSLVPSQTELLFDLGLDEEIVGITKFCVHPGGKCRTRPKIGGTKNFHFNAIEALRPDLIIGNKEENYREGIDWLRSRYPVWMSDVATLDDALRMIRSVGELVGKSPAAHALASEIQVSFQALSIPARRTSLPGRVAYLIWRQPWMAAGSGTFIGAMLASSGFENAFGHLVRYPVISPAQLREATPDLVFLPSEPYPFREKHRSELREICPEAKITLVDGEPFSWYGSRLRHAAGYFRELADRL